MADFKYVWESPVTDHSPYSAKPQLLTMQFGDTAGHRMTDAPSGEGKYNLHRKGHYHPVAIYAFS